MREVFRNPFFRIGLEAPRGVARLVRTDLPFSSLEEMLAAHNDVVRELGRLSRRRLLLDLREGAAGRNDPEFERGLAEARQRIYRQCERMAVLVRTAAGLLQVRRLASEDAMTLGVFRDEEEALRYLVD